VQLAPTWFCVLALALLWGCTPGTTDKKPPKNPPAKSAVKDTPAAETPTAKDPPADETRANDLPGVETPVKDMPNPKPAKETPVFDPPVKEPTAEKPAAGETSAMEAPVAAKMAGEAPAAVNIADASVDPTQTPTVKWLPKPVANPDAEAADQPAMKPYTENIPATDVKFDMAPIPGGEFTLGSPASEKDRKDDEGPQAKVKIEPFWMEKHEVTWDEYELWGLALDNQRRKMKNEQPTDNDKVADAISRPTKPYSDMTFGMGKEGYPAICMTQLAAKLYCKWLSAKTGRYYRLPSEAEWEYACRAGTKTAYSFGDDPEKLDDYAWSTANAEEKYHRVGKKKPNAWGLYDMHGNVGELCLDQYIADRYKQYEGKAAESPLAVATTAYPHVVRGGAWTDEAPLLRSAARRGSSKDWKQQDPQIPQSIWYFTDADFVGFRVVRPLRTPTPEEDARYDLDEFQKQDLIDYKKAQAGKE
jgi:formylglycine-generating enzyme required for sulfatase activity